MCGTHVLVNEQVTREAILAHLEALLEQVRVDDVLLLYLAGHGVQDTAVSTYYFSAVARHRGQHAHLRRAHDRRRRDAAHPAQQTCAAS